MKIWIAMISLHFFSSVWSASVPLHRAAQLINMNELAEVMKEFLDSSINSFPSSSMPETTEPGCQVREMNVCFATTAHDFFSTLFNAHMKDKRLALCRLVELYEECVSPYTINQCSRKARLMHDLFVRGAQYLCTEEGYNNYLALTPCLSSSRSQLANALSMCKEKVSHPFHDIYLCILPDVFTSCAVDATRAICHGGAADSMREALNVILVPVREAVCASETSALTNAVTTHSVSEERKLSRSRREASEGMGSFFGSSASEEGASPQYSLSDFFQPQYPTRNQYFMAPQYRAPYITQPQFSSPFLTGSQFSGPYFTDSFFTTPEPSSEEVSMFPNFPSLFTTPEPSSEEAATSPDVTTPEPSSEEVATSPDVTTPELSSEEVATSPDVTTPETSSEELSTTAPDVTTPETSSEEQSSTAPDVTTPETSSEEVTSNTTDVTTPEPSSEEAGTNAPEPSSEEETTTASVVTTVVSSAAASTTAAQIATPSEIPATTQAGTIPEIIVTTASSVTSVIASNTTEQVTTTTLEITSKNITDSATDIPTTTVAVSTINIVPNTTEIFSITTFIKPLEIITSSPTVATTVRTTVTPVALSTEAINRANHQPPPYQCYECHSGAPGFWQNFFCPADGNIQGWAAKPVTCYGPCVSVVTKFPKGEVYRACSTNYYFPFQIPQDGCLKNDKEIICFCSGDHCNNRNMVAEQEVFSSDGFSGANLV